MPTVSAASLFEKLSRLIALGDKSGVEVFAKSAASSFSKDPGLFISSVPKKNATIVEVLLAQRMKEKKRMDGKQDSKNEDRIKSLIEDILYSRLRCKHYCRFLVAEGFALESLPCKMYTAVQRRELIEYAAEQGRFDVVLETFHILEKENRAFLKQQNWVFLKENLLRGEYTLPKLRLQIITILKRYTSNVFEESERELLKKQPKDVKTLPEVTTPEETKTPEKGKTAEEIQEEIWGAVNTGNLVALQFLQKNQFFSCNIKREGLTLLYKAYDLGFTSFNFGGEDAPEEEEFEAKSNMEETEDQSLEDIVPEQSKMQASKCETKEVTLEVKPSEFHSNPKMRKEIFWFILQYSDGALRTGNNQNVIHLAAQKGASALLIALLLAKGADHEALDNANKKPIDYLTDKESKTKEVPIQLLERGLAFFLHAKDGERLYNGMLAELKEISDTLHQDFIYAIFLKAIQYNKVDWLKKLLRDFPFLIIKINDKNNQGETPLTLAILWMQQEAASVLLENGANPNVKNQQGKSPFAYAVEKQYFPILHLLVPHPQLEIKPQEYKELSANLTYVLEQAIRGNDYPMIRKLLMAGANPNAGYTSPLRALTKQCPKITSSRREGEEEEQRKREKQEIKLTIKALLMAGADPVDDKNWGSPIRDSIFVKDYQKILDHRLQYKNYIDYMLATGFSWESLPSKIYPPTLRLKLLHHAAECGRWDVVLKIWDFLEETSTFLRPHDWRFLLRYLSQGKYALPETRLKILEQFKKNDPQIAQDKTWQALKAQLVGESPVTRSIQDEIMEAIKKGDIQALQQLQNKPYFSLDIKWQENRTWLDVAMEKYHTDLKQEEKQDLKEDAQTVHSGGKEEKKSSAQAVFEFVLQNSDCSVRTGNNLSILHLAVLQGASLTTLALLIAQGAEPYARDNADKTPGDYCRDDKGIKGIKIGLEAHYALLTQGVDFFFTEENKSAVLAILTDLGLASITQTKPDAKAEKKLEKNETLEHYTTQINFLHFLFLEAVRKKNLDFLKEFSKCYSIDINFQNKQGETALMLACKVGDYALVQWLLEQGADPHLTDHTGSTAFVLAANAEIAKLLLNAGVDINAMIQGETALAHALYGEESERVKWLLGLGANPNIKTKSGKTLLQITPNTFIAQYLLKAGAKVSVKDWLDATHRGKFIEIQSKHSLFSIIKSFFTPPNHNYLYLTRLIKGGYLNSFMKALDSKPPLYDVFDNKGKPALHLAYEAFKEDAKNPNRAQIFSKLLETNIQVTDKNTKQTLLHLAAQNKAPLGEILLFLLKGADVKKKDRHQRKAISYFVSCREDSPEEKIIQKLLQQGIDYLFQKEHAADLNTVWETLRKAPQGVLTHELNNLFKMACLAKGVDIPKENELEISPTEAKLSSVQESTPTSFPSSPDPLNAAFPGEKKIYSPSSSSNTHAFFSLEDFGIWAKKLEWNTYQREIQKISKDLQAVNSDQAVEKRRVIQRQAWNTLHQQVGEICKKLDGLEAAPLEDKNGVGLTQHKINLLHEIQTHIREVLKKLREDSDFQPGCCIHEWYKALSDFYNRVGEIALAMYEERYQKVQSRHSH